MTGLIVLAAVAFAFLAGVAVGRRTGRREREERQRRVNRLVRDASRVSTATLTKQSAFAKR